MQVSKVTESSGSLDDVKRRILARVPLGDLIGERVPLAARGGNRTGCCPFHAEKTPSFHVYDDHYYCYGCKVHGDAISFVRHTEGVGFVEALRFLAGKYGVEAPELEAARVRLGRHRDEASLFKMMAEAQELYVERLAGAGGAAARAYLERRGFSPASIRDFGFGLTPEEGFGLVKHLRGQGYREQDMIDCSLATASTRDGRPYDFLRQRVTIPIRDGQGRLIAFGGRALGDEQPKYKNSGTTKLFDKSHTLFGLDRARRVMRERGFAIVVEGYMDVLQLWQQGYPEAVACLGTAFTEGHLRQLRHATNAVILLFDGDGAGRRATLGAVSVALTAPEVQVRAVMLPDGLDPDDFVRRHGGAALAPLLAKAEPLLDFVVRARLAATDALAVPELVSKEFIPWLARLPDRVQRDYLAHKIAHRTGVPLEHLLRPLTGPTLPRAGATRPERPGPPAPAVPLQPMVPGVYDIVGHLFWSQPGELDPTRLEQLVGDDLELDPDAAELVHEILAHLSAGRVPAAVAEGAWTSAGIPGVQQLLARLREAEAAFACNDRAARLEKAAAHLKVGRIRGTIAALRSQLARLATQPEHAAEVAQLLKTVSELGRQLP